MREPVTADRIRSFMRALGNLARQAARIYLVGGATAVLVGWRPTTIDVDIKIIAENDSILKEIPALKETLQINVELASPDQFIPPLPGWEERSPFIGQEGTLSFYHYDYYAQALAKIERGHQQDIRDIEAMIGMKLVLPKQLLQHFEHIESQLYRYPAVDPATFRRAVEETVRNYVSSS